jgi:hypothetical protein
MLTDVSAEYNASIVAVEELGPVYTVTATGLEGGGGAPVASEYNNV